MKEEILERQFAEATKRGQETLEAAPKAKTVSYNVKTKRLVLELTNGVTAMIATNLVQIFQNAAPEQIKNVEIAVEGLYLRWKSLGEDLFVPKCLVFENN